MRVSADWVETIRIFAGIEQQAESFCVAVRRSQGECEVAFATIGMGQEATHVVHAIQCCCDGQSEASATIQQCVNRSGFINSPSK